MKQRNICRHVSRSICAAVALVAVEANNNAVMADSNRLPIAPRIFIGAADLDTPLCPDGRNGSLREISFNVKDLSDPAQACTNARNGVTESSEAYGSELESCARLCHRNNLEPLFMLSDFVLLSFWNPGSVVYQYVQDQTAVNPVEPIKDLVGLYPNGFIRASRAGRCCCLGDPELTENDWRFGLPSHLQGQM